MGKGGSLSSFSLTFLQLPTAYARNAYHEDVFSTGIKERERVELDRKFNRMRF